jgi:hypothetical protein
MERYDAGRPDYAIIVGQGRSGTNWLLDLLDLSPRTHCRNEANELADSPLAQLPSPTVRNDFSEDFGQQWDRAIALSALRLGARDSIGTHPKDHLYEPARRLGGAALLNKNKARKLLSLTTPSLGTTEWFVPWWFASERSLKGAYLVLKLNQVPAWAQWLLLNRPQALVIHIVRHPGGFLNSWQKRYLALEDPEAVKKANFQRLEQIAKSDPHWAERFGNLEAMSVHESELWYWCYATETIHNEGCDPRSAPVENRKNYLPVVYEELVADALAKTKQIYEKCHLPWTVDIERKVTQKAFNSKTIATAWRNKLSSEHVKLVERILDRSLMNQWWQG